MILKIQNYFQFLDESGKLLLGYLNDKLNITDISFLHCTGYYNTTPIYSYNANIIYLASNFHCEATGNDSSSVNYGLYFLNETGGTLFKIVKNSTLIYDSTNTVIQNTLSNITVKNFWFSKVTQIGGEYDYFKFSGLKITYLP